ncbi:hypothetical protein ACJX0J_033184, partial [Zea mays]
YRHVEILTSYRHVYLFIFIFRILLLARTILKILAAVEIIPLKIQDDADLDTTIASKNCVVDLLEFSMQMISKVQYHLAILAYTGPMPTKIGQGAPSIAMDLEQNFERITHEIFCTTCGHLLMPQELDTVKHDQMD